MNMVEQFFRNISEGQLKRVVFKNVDELVVALEFFCSRALRIQSHSSGWQAFGTSGEGHAVEDKTQNSSDRVKHYTSD